MPILSILISSLPFTILLPCLPSCLFTTNKQQQIHFAWIIHACFFIIIIVVIYFLTAEEENMF